MKDLLSFTLKADIDAWAAFYKVVTGIPPDPDTGLERVVVVDGPFNRAEQETVQINAVIYNLDSQGNPINGLVDPSRSIVPRRILIEASNKDMVSLDGTFKKLTDAEQKNLEYGKDYLEGFEAYRRDFKEKSFDQFEFIEKLIAQSKQI